jgi:hypothetical protein
LAGTPGTFLPWHGTFLQRSNQWRAEFGYSPTVPWYPGSPLPTGPDIDHTPSLREVYVAASNRIPPWFTLSGNGIPGAGTARAAWTPAQVAQLGPDPTGGGERRLRDFPNLAALSRVFEVGFHGQVHCNIGVDLGGGFFSGSAADFGSMCKSSSPKDPMFWRWHGFIDVH